MNMPSKQEGTKSTENKTPEKSSDTGWSKPYMKESRLIKKNKTYLSQKVGCPKLQVN